MPEGFKKNGDSRIENLWRLIGNTPMIELAYRFRGGEPKKILVKCEQYNLTHSIKDRMALYILQKAIEQGFLKPADTIVEVTSGNLGISFAAIGRALGHRVKILMPDGMGMERRSVIKSHGAEIELVSKEQGGALGAVRIAEAMAHFDDVFLPRAFANRYNTEVHDKTTGREIGHYLLLKYLQPTAFVAGVGSGGTIMGVGKYLRSIYPQVRIHPLEPVEGKHRIQGISDELSPPIADLKYLDRVVKVHEGDAILMAQALKNLGLGVGISSGANVVGAIRLQTESAGEQVVITVFPDDDKKYGNTDLFKTEPVRTEYLTPQVELLEYKVVDNHGKDKP